MQFSGKMHVMPLEAPVHLLVAWAVGGLMSFLADSYRRYGNFAVLLDVVSTSAVCCLAAQIYGMTVQSSLSKQCVPEPHFAIAYVVIS